MYVDINLKRSSNLNLLLIRASYYLNRAQFKRRSIKTVILQRELEYITIAWGKLKRSTKNQYLREYLREAIILLFFLHVFIVNLINNIYLFIIIYLIS